MWLAKHTKVLWFSANQVLTPPERKRALVRATLVEQRTPSCHFILALNEGLTKSDKATLARATYTGLIVYLTIFN